MARVVQSLRKVSAISLLSYNSPHSLVLIVCRKHSEASVILSSANRLLWTNKVCPSYSERPKRRSGHMFISSYDHCWSYAWETGSTHWMQERMTYRAHISYNEMIWICNRRHVQQNPLYVHVRELGEPKRTRGQNIYFDCVKSQEEWQWHLNPNKPDGEDRKSYFRPQNHEWRDTTQLWPRNKSNLLRPYEQSRSKL